MAGREQLASSLLIFTSVPILGDSGWSAPLAIALSVLWGLSSMSVNTRVPKVVVVFSGKRKSGKDYITEKLLENLTPKKAEILVRCFFLSSIIIQLCNEVSHTGLSSRGALHH